MQNKKASFIFRLVSVLFLLASLILANSPSSAQEFEGKPPLKIVQIGDSYSAGNGARSDSVDENFGNEAAFESAG